MTLTFTERQFDTGTITINYAEGGDNGRPLVALHGMTAQWQELLPILRPLGEQWHVYAPDHRGHGKSGRGAGQYRMENYTADTVTFLRKCVGEPVILHGHSLGGLVAMNVAAEAPDTVRALILEDPALVIYRQPSETVGVHPYFQGVYETLKNGATVDSIVAWLKTFNPPDTPDSVLRPWAEMLHHVDPEVLAPVPEDKRADINALPGILKQITCPVLLVQADPALGAATQDQHVEIVKTYLAHCKVVQMKGVDHVIHIRQPQALLTHMNAFLAEIEAV